VLGVVGAGAFFRWRLHYRTEHDRLHVESKASALLGSRDAGPVHDVPPLISDQSPAATRSLAGVHDALVIASFRLLMDAKSFATIFGQQEQSCSC